VAKERSCWPVSGIGCWTTGGIFDVEAKASLIARIEHEALEPGFWADNRAARAKNSALASAKKDLEAFAALKAGVEDLETSAELLEDAADPSLLAEFDEGCRLLGLRLDRMDFTRMLNGPYDRHGALLNIKPGAGGTESQDWAQMLLRLYSRWAERRGFAVTLLEVQPGEEAGIKSATLKVDGDWAFGLLRSEKGVHRLVRISPFDSQGRRHTSFASAEPLPQLEDDGELVIDDKDLRIDVFRASGAGGQHVNRTESAVRITHLPSGIVVQCQNDRSQGKNKESAMGVLRSKLVVLAEEERRRKMDGITGERQDISFGSQVRNYVLYPYQQVKDTRTDLESSQTQAVLDGDIDAFIEAYLKMNSQEPQARG
jgi:peptide chain release factor 2